MDCYLLETQYFEKQEPVNARTTVNVCWSTSLRITIEKFCRNLSRYAGCCGDRCSHKHCV